MRKITDCDGINSVVSTSHSSRSDSETCTLDGIANPPVAILTSHDIMEHEILGCGSFSKVCRVTIRNTCTDHRLGSYNNTKRDTIIRNQQTNPIDPTDGRHNCSLTSLMVSAFDVSDESVQHEQQQQQQQNTSPRTCKLVLKRMLPQYHQNCCIIDKQRILDGIRFEAHLLSNIIPPHDHIIRIYGISSNLYDTHCKNDDDVFIVLEQLDCTLACSIKKWKVERRHNISLLHPWEKILQKVSCTRRPIDVILRLEHKRVIKIGLGIAKALQHLHKYGILYRDLKPSNVGIDQTGNVRIFDFDLSRPCRITKTTTNPPTTTTTMNGAKYEQQQPNGDNNRRHTVCAGSIRYMSPECALGNDYDFASDVYSFAIVLWETYTLECPFDNAKDYHAFFTMVFKNQIRPSLRYIRDRNISSLIRNCWDPRPDLRPSFTSIVSSLTSMVTPPQ